MVVFGILLACSVRNIYAIYFDPIHAIHMRVSCVVFVLTNACRAVDNLTIISNKNFPIYGFDAIHDHTLMQKAISDY